MPKKIKGIGYFFLLQTPGKRLKNLPNQRVVFLKIIIEMFLISHRTVLTIRFTVLLQVVTRCIKDYVAGRI
jgi:hypothetical protein